MIEVCKCCGKSEGVIIYRLDCTKGSKRATILTNLGHNIFLQDPPKGKMSFPDSTDAVFICTPPETHLEIAKEHLGKHIFIEKPLATSYNEAYCFVGDFELTGKVGAVGYNWKYHPEIKELKKKKFRNLRMAYLYYHTNHEEWKGNYTPNYFLETHEIESAIHLFGMPHYTPSSLFSENGFRLWFSGSISIYNSWDKKSNNRGIHIRNRAKEIDIELPKEDVWDTYVAETKHFMDCVSGKKRAGKPLTSMRDGLRTLAIVEQCALSA